MLSSLYLVIIINAVPGVAQHVKAGKAIRSAEKMAYPRALIIRSGIAKEIASDNSKSRISIIASSRINKIKS